MNVSTVDALSTVLNHELPEELAECRLALERARMSAEDLRGAMASPYSNNFCTRNPRHHWLTWREFGQVRNRVCDHLFFNVIESAHEILESARRDIRVFLGSGGEVEQQAVIIKTCYNAMCATDRALRDRSEDSADESDDEVYGMP